MYVLLYYSKYIIILIELKKVGVSEKIINKNKRKQVTNGDNNACCLNKLTTIIN